MYDHYVEQHIAHHLESQDDEYYKFGYRIFGPYLFGMSAWLYQEITKQDLKRVLFLARDGYMVKEAFDLLFEASEFEGKRVESSYIYASRRSFAVPALTECQNVEEIFTKYPYLKTSFGKTLKKLGLNTKDVKKFPQSLLDTVFNNSRDLLAHPEARAALEQVFPNILQNSHQEAKLLQEYFKQEKIQGDIAIFDIGWHGTLQKALFSLKEKLNISSIRGYYTGILPKVKTDSLKKSQGYLFDSNHNQAYYKFMGLNFPIFERLFQPREGSCIGFKKEGDRIYSKLENFFHEKVNEDLANLLAIQTGALTFVKNFSEELPSDSPYWYEKDSNFWFSGFEQTIKRPILSEVKALGSLTFENEGELYYLAAPQKHITYILKPHQFMRDFHKSWKVGFLKSLFKIPLPYYAFLKKLYKLDI
ncbi:glycosyl transferase [uncultured Lactococcus sp.]|uniref:glycosyl transferase n=1 Tax=uncultured Lactococcus sp. TaxID=167973 RepID=UPI0027DBD1B7|nr:glycosyl transferase [uncultured Lactococcus sp.]